MISKSTIASLVIGTTAIAGSALAVTVNSTPGQQDFTTPISKPLVTDPTSTDPLNNIDTVPTQTIDPTPLPTPPVVTPPPFNGGDDDEESDDDGSYGHDDDSDHGSWGNYGDDDDEDGEYESDDDEGWDD